MSGPDVKLRAFGSQDSVAVYRWLNDPRATRNLMGQRKCFTRGDARAWTRRAQKTTGEDRKFAILAADQSEPIGFTALYGLFRQTAPELGILIGDPAPRGSGRIAEALRSFGPSTSTAPTACMGASRLEIAPPSG